MGPCWARLQQDPRLAWLSMAPTFGWRIGLATQFPSFREYGSAKGTDARPTKHQRDIFEMRRELSSPLARRYSQSTSSCEEGCVPDLRQIQLSRNGGSCKSRWGIIDTS